MNSMVNKKAAKREKMMNMPSYRLMVGTAKYMEKELFVDSQCEEDEFPGV